MAILPEERARLQQLTAALLYSEIATAILLKQSTPEVGDVTSYPSNIIVLKFNRIDLQENCSGKQFEFECAALFKLGFF